VNKQIKVNTKLSKYVYKPLKILLLTFLVLFISLLVYVHFKSQIPSPEVPEIKIGKRIKVSDNYYVLGNNYLKKNNFGIWEMYIEGSPYERGLVYGELAKELIQYQEEVFVDQIKSFVPSRIWQKTLRLIIGFFNSELPKHIPLENQQEIYGISKCFSDEFDFIAPKYTRILNYHAAHDIGHALNDYSLVGCTSFSLKGSKTTDKNIIIGRNFDFYVSDAFAKDKMIVFVNPTSGYKFSSYSWAGFTGVASGLNEKGLSVTINASKSDLPLGSRMPISLLAREILQYASTTEEAIKIAEKRHTFVSETLMIGSAIDGKTILIEKSPTKMNVYESKSDQLICTNHYQGDLFKKDPVNIKNIQESDSKLRYARVSELINKESVLDVNKAAGILRDQYAENEDSLGIGNPRAINQLNGHHSVIIIPQKKLFYISTFDFQLGPYVCYDLSATFTTRKAQITDSINADPFLLSQAYKGYKEFRRIKQEINKFLILNNPLSLNSQEINYFISLNAESYLSYETIGRYFYKKEDFNNASKYFKLALSKRVASPKVESEIKLLLQNCSRR
jgi:isopenicillin-N N-acyltransferase-like protein